jgi:soluble lytic murein transglycosylase
MNITTLLSIIIFTISYSSTASADYIDDAMRYADKKEWSKALVAAKSHHDPVLRKTILSRQFLDPNDKSATFEQIISFAEMNPHWPRINQIKENAEIHLDSSSPKNVIVKWFSTNTPQTPNGYKFLALSAPGRITDPVKLSKIIKDGWIYGDFNTEETKRFLAQNKSILTSNDHIKKIDALMWHNQRTAAKLVASAFGSKEKKYLETFIALYDKKPNGNSLFNSLPKELQHNSGILYCYLSQFKKDDIIPENIASMILDASYDRIHASMWWKMQNLFAKNMIQQKKYGLAYKIVSTHNGQFPKDVSEAEWLAGWIALHYLHDPKGAYEHFNKMYNVVQLSISIAKASYWMGLSAATMKDSALAHKWYTEAASYNFTFAGQMAMLELKKESITLPSHPPQISKLDKISYHNNELARATNMFIKHGRNDLALTYAQSAIAAAKNSGEAALVVDAIKNCKNRHYMTEIAKSAAQRGYVMTKANYPAPYKFHPAIEPALTYSIILRESVFDQFAISHANAHGLMQVVPATGCIMAKTLKTKCNTSKLTKDPAYNISLGNKYLKDLIDRYNGSYLLAIAAYNAGPHVIDRWIISNGDPRKLKHPRQVMYWIEAIPYWETREYVQRVLENVQVYRKVLGASNNLGLKKDLLRGT